jgi:hypothetical protein
MKNIFLLSVMICITTWANAQSCDFLIPEEGRFCPKSKERLYVIPGEGILRHIKCPKNKGGDIFILSSNTESTHGCLLNKDYDLGKERMRIESAGPKFFIVKTPSAKYKYDFKLKSWTTLKKMDPGLSTGNREDP